MTTATFPWCSAPREDGLPCPRCGASYAKADLDDLALELKFRIAAIRAMLALAVLFRLGSVAS